jgi:membrane fusion protein, copper/silver efflux system
MKNYRIGFVFALVGNIVLAGVLAALWWRSRPAKSAPESGATTAVSPIEMPAVEPSSASPPATDSPLVPVQISPQRLQAIGVKIGVVQERAVEGEIRATGSVAVDETRLAYVQLRFSGYIQKVFVTATYQYVRQGDPLFTIYSPELVATEREYLVAKQNQQRLMQSTITGVAESATSLLNSAVERLKQWGVPPEEIERLESTGQVQQELQINSPVSGYVMERNALPSVSVQPETRIYTIADLSTVWVLADVFQSDLPRIQLGDPATLSAETYPGRAFAGRIDFIYPQVDMNTRTTRVRLVFANPDTKLSPGMFVNTVLKVPMGRQLVIPATGVLQSGTRQIAFVDRENGYLEPREIELGPSVGDEFVVVKGLKVGDHIVTSANFLIDSESQLQAALGSFTPPPPPAGKANATNEPEMTLDFSTEPSPPRKGNNTFRVRLRDSKGAPVSEAEVTVVFSMPAMPQMGMPALRVSTMLADKGNGLYEGNGNLGTGGTWQVSIVVRRAGQVIDTKQLSLNAEGGM